LYCLVKAFKSEHPSTVKKYLIFSGIIIGYIALTKNIFGYVLMALIISAVILWLINRKTVNYRKCMVVLGVALITTMPYLAYSYSFSERVFYWGSLGGNNLYWMTTPYEEEYGTWFQAYVPARSDSISEPYFLPGSGKSIRLNHQKDLEEIHKYKGIAQDDAWKRVSFRNIREHPGKYLQNCFSNIGRILFEMPHSYMIQRPGNLLRLPLNGIIVVLLLFLVIPTLINWRKIFFPIRFLLFFVLLYLGASTLACAESRMFTLVVPLWLLFIAYMLPKTVTIKSRFGGADKKTN
jgi:4-amino-4-deoxy-L-arabinose transferase-like glycosyltransferase